MGPATQPISFVRRPVDVVQLAAHELVFDPNTTKRLTALVCPGSFALHFPLYPVTFDRVALPCIGLRQHLTRANERPLSLPLPVDPSTSV